MHHVSKIRTKHFDTQKNMNRPNAGPALVDIILSWCKCLNKFEMTGIKWTHSEHGAFWIPGGTVSLKPTWMRRPKSAQSNGKLKSTEQVRKWT